MGKTLAGSVVAAIAMLALVPHGNRGGGQTGRQEIKLAVQNDTTAQPAQSSEISLAQVVLKRADNGHYYATAKVNGADVRFLVDSGASLVVLSRNDALRAGIPVSDGEFTGSAQTANGTVALKPVMIDRLSIGPLEKRAIDAAVTASDMDVSLLGQSFLTRLEHVEIDDGEMRLR